MPPGRFQVSPFKNIQANVAKREAWSSELPLSTSSPPESSDGLKATDEYTIARGSQTGSLIFLPHGNSGKFGQRAATWSTASRQITDFDASFVERLLAVGSEDGRIVVAHQPSAESVEDTTSNLSPQMQATLSLPQQGSVDSLSFHPTSASLLLASQGSSGYIYDVSGSASDAVYHFDGPQKGIWHASWNSHGRLVQIAGKDNTISLWDLRESSEKAAATAPGHQGFNKPSRVASVNDMVFTTGFSKMRERECSLWDPRNFVKPLSATRLDNNTGVLMPLVDHSRRIVYLAGRSDMAIRWVELTGASTLTSSSAPLPAASLGAALLPSTSATLDVMQAEVARLVVSSADSIVPITYQVPRRTYLDFYPELFPPQKLYLSPSQPAQGWLDGSDEPCDVVLPAPKTQWGRADSTSARSTVSATGQPPANDGERSRGHSSTLAAGIPEQGTSSHSERGDEVSAAVRRTADLTIAKETPTADPRQPAKTTGANFPDRQSPTEVSPAQPGTQRGTEVRHSSSLNQPNQPPSEQRPRTVASATTKRPTSEPTHWARSFLAGKTALKPDYDDVHGVASTLAAGVQLLKANGDYLVYPLSGPGGRVAYHSVAETGRMPTHPPSLATGSEIVDFALDPFDRDTVYIACSDAKVRVYRIPKDTQGDFGETAAVLSGSMDKILGLEPHPCIRGLLLTWSEDGGEGVLRIWDTWRSAVLTKLPVDGKGIHSAAWSLQGDRIAVSCKDRKIRIVEPRSAASGSTQTITGSSHDSVRPSKIVWVDDDHVLTCGFSRTAFREVLLHRLQGGKLEVLGRTNIDISPAPLFPIFDPDTRILFAYAKGERTCHAYEVQPHAAEKGKIFTKLPSFDHGSLQSAFAFLPKQLVDVKKVEVAKAYRLTPNSIQLVSFTIPRAKMDFFQDDVFPPTLDRLQPVHCTPDEWLRGSMAEPGLVDLRPEGMPLLSEAPPPAPKAKTQVYAKQLSREESEQQYLDNLFRNKQAEVDSDEDDERVRRRDAAEDDDW